MKNQIKSMWPKLWKPELLAALFALIALSSALPDRYFYPAALSSSDFKRQAAPLPAASNKEKDIFNIFNFMESLAGATPTLPEGVESDTKHGVKMGVANVNCDDAKTNLKIDWNDDAANYTCYTPKELLKIDFRTPATLRCVNLPKNYFPQHHCVNSKIEYNHIVPTHGDHRPLWPVFGEYIFVPPQRWLHNIEHGAVVMLYHPCADPFQINLLKKLVVGCLRKHVITPYNRLPADRPLALVAWGCRLMMNHVNENDVIKFIKENALHGPEGTYAKEGQYTHMLIEKAQPPNGSDINDSVLCPSYSSV